MHCDLNCDMGEGIGNDEAIMPFITSANIACGYHAGDEATMQQTVLLAKKFNVAIGAHPSFLDRENFGRTEMQTTPDEVYNLVTVQIKGLEKVAVQNNATLHHVKPHGALYNMAAKDSSLARAIVHAVQDCNPNLILYGLSGSFLISEAEALGLQTASEVFADRTYSNNGSLTPRSQPNAVIEDEETAIQQVLQMVKTKTVTTVSKKEIPMLAQTICLHGDGKHAVAFAQKINKALKEEGLVLQAVNIL
jgi:5-oxoprolinase (ATP-hydrolysing) subunit A